MRKLLFLLSVCLLTSFAYGVTITNGTQHVLLFKDTFETVPPGEWDFPIAEVGSWTDRPGDDRVTASPDPPAFQGSRQMWIMGGGSGVYGSVDGGAANGVGDFIRVTLAVKPTATYNSVFLYGTSPAKRDTDVGSYGIGYILFIGGTAEPGWGGIWEIPNKAYIYLGGGLKYVLLGDIDPNAWNTLVVDYVNGAGTYSASLNSAPAVSGPVSWATGVLQGIGIDNRDGMSKWDAAPVPPIPFEPNNGTVVLVK